VDRWWLRQCRHRGARTQASGAYRCSQLASAVGLVVVVVGAFLALNVNDSASKVAVTAVTAVGTLMSGYLGKTFLHTYQQTLEQLNRYFQEPLVSSYVLKAERVAKQVSLDSKRNEALEFIVEELVRGLGRNLAANGKPAEVNGVVLTADDSSSNGGARPRRRSPARTFSATPA
jgi:type III secretory pathway component EscS